MKPLTEKDKRKIPTLIQPCSDEVAIHYTETDVLSAVALFTKKFKEAEILSGEDRVNCEHCGLRPYIYYRLRDGYFCLDCLFEKIRDECFQIQKQKDEAGK